jgi:hypothetical protein
MPRYLKINALVLLLMLVSKRLIESEVLFAFFLVIFGVTVVGYAFYIVIKRDEYGEETECV